ncbi:MAG TPA: hypothetical protein VGM82_03525 [Gemmatimonadaceae bacterium]|jgi:hypothetical protein
MRYKQNAVLTSLRRVQQFFDDNTQGLSALNPAARKELDDLVVQLTTLSAAQESSRRSSKGETSRSRALRVALLQYHMVPISQVAKLKLPAVPEFSALSQPPRDLSTEGLVSAATAMADAATLHLQIFIASGLATTFIDDLRTAAQALSDSVTQRNSHQYRRSGATGGLASLETHGRAMLKILNALILAQIGENAELRSAWTSAKTVRQKPGPSANAQPVASTGGQTTTTPVVVGKVGPSSTPSAISPVIASPTTTSPTAASPGSVPAAA